MKKIRQLIACILIVMLAVTSVPMASAFTVSAAGGISYIELDTPTNVTISESYDVVQFFFEPETDGVYLFSSGGDIDSFGSILDIEENLLAANDDCDDGTRNFSVGYELNAGETYILQAGCFDDITGSYTVTVTEFAIKSIEIDDVKIVENTNVNPQQEYNPETGLYDLEWKEYYYYVQGTATAGNGDTAYIYDSQLNLGGKFYLEIEDTQSYENQWTVGNTYTATASLFGISDTFNIEIVENPIEEIVVEELYIIEGTNQSTEQYYDYESDEYLEYLKYDYAIPEVKVILKDSSVVTLERYEYFEYAGMENEVEIFDPQSYYETWGLGKHEIIVSLLGRETTTFVNIIESPVQNIKFREINLIENYDGQSTGYVDENGVYAGDFFWYSYMPQAVVTLNDGSKLESINGTVSYKGLDYDIEYNDLQEEDHWQIGEHSVEAKLLGKDTEFTVNVIKNPYVKLRIDGYEELIITLYKEDGEQEVINANYLDVSHCDDWNVYTMIFAENRVFHDAIFALLDEDGDDFNIKLRLDMYGLQSNVLEGNAWLWANAMATDCIFAAKSYRFASEKILGKPFLGFNSYVTAENIDDVITLSANICGDIWYYESESIGDAIYSYMDIETVKANVEEVFGFKDIDVTKSAGYDESNPQIVKVLFLDGDMNAASQNVYFENGKWVFEYKPQKSCALTYDVVRVVMNGSYKIEKIEYLNRPFKDVVSIDVIENPTKTTYGLYERLSPAGLEIKLNFEDGTNTTVTNGYTLNGFDSTSVGEKTVTVKYAGFTDTFKVNVIERRNELVLNNTNLARITDGGQIVDYYFTPEVTGEYVISSQTDLDPMVDLYDSNDEWLDGNDDGGVYGNEFELTYTLIAGETYKYSVKFYSEGQVGELPFIFYKLYNVKYDANSGSAAPATQSKKYGETVVLSEEIPTRNGYVFEGWATSADAINPEYKAGSLYVLNEDVTLYAVWRTNGDVNGDGNINASDLASLKSELFSFGGSYKRGCDINDDGAVDMLDLIRLKTLLLAV